MKGKKLVAVLAAAAGGIVLAVLAVLLVLSMQKYSRLNRQYQTETADYQSVCAANEAALSQAESRISDYAAQQEANAATAQENAELKEKLAAAENERARLESENSAIRSEMATLKAKKAAAVVEQMRAQIAAAQSIAQAGQAPAEKVCYLTFDDGPSENTLKILDILANYNIQATFFVVGTGRLDYLPRMVAAGHTIGLHSMTHSYAQIYANESAYWADLKAISDAVQNACGVESHVVRFPGGSSNAVSKRYSATPQLMSVLASQMPGLGYAYFDWNVSSEDASGNNVAVTKIVNAVLSGAKNKTAICVLMHDTNAKNTTVEALPMIITRLYESGYTFAALTPESYGFHHPISN